MVLIKENNIRKISFISSVTIVLLLVLTLGGVIISEKHKEFKKSLQWIKRTYTSQQKEQLKSEVAREINHINGLRRRAEKTLKQTLEQRVSEAHALASRLYDLKKDMGDDAIQSLIRESLGSIRFHKGRGYYFILDKDGGYVLYPPDRAKEGQNSKGTYSPEEVSQTLAITKTARKKGQGFIKYTWIKPGQDAPARFPKITYVKTFTPFGWVIGTGEYIDTFEKDVQQEIFSDLNEAQSGQVFPDYLFIYKLHKKEGGEAFATILANPNRPDLVGTTISDDFKDTRGFMFRRAMLRGIKEKGEAFITYWYKKPGQKGEFAKLSYFKYLPEWDWIVAGGGYLDDLEKRIATMQSDLGQEIKKTIQILTLFLVVICAVFLGLAYLFSRGVGNLFEDYRKTQNAQQEKLERLNSILKIKANTDALTQIHNRAFFNAQVEKEISRSNRYQKKLGFILFDIDDFKQINDRFGHLSGDQILKEISDLCRKNIRTSDVFARWGGEEFVILVPEDSGQAAFTLSEKLRHLIETHEFSSEISITCSFGVTDYKSRETIEDLMNRADKALYKSKQTGKNRVTAL